MKQKATLAQKKNISNRVYKFGYKRLADLIGKNYHQIYNKCNGFDTLYLDDIEAWVKIMDVEKPK